MHYIHNLFHFSVKTTHKIVENIKSIKSVRDRSLEPTPGPSDYGNYYLYFQNLI